MSALPGSFRQEVMAAFATVDWFLHHAYLCQTSGESIQLFQTGRQINAKVL